ncbi:MAG: hypothetical protein HN742_03700 [Lentisphaerae bacterium]|nr:hypothetical protein [Lentisphaerota bacterium]MBT5605320.1 hypothetical protein [Lentisphaerota bacterium]MBT7055890.1 hypothetical protein [Lentisphaerota bacterium]MBT7840946.1 hypothetical protein [Lentisphaerota bacterium]
MGFGIPGRGASISFGRKGLCYTMTLRAVLLGLLTAAFISGYAHLNDFVVHNGRFISDLMPVAVFGTLVFFLLIINPLLKKLKESWVLTAQELGVIIALALIACSVPSYGVVQCIPTSIMLPFHFQRMRPGWAQADVTSMAPKRMMPTITGDEEQVLNGYVMGLGEADQHISFTQIPWSAWSETLWFWLPLLLSITIAAMGLAVVFHKQWSKHEQLPYPITRFAHALLPGKGEARSRVFQSKLFWIGFGVIFAIGLNNYLCRWFPRALIPVRTYLDFSPLARLFPILVDGHGLRLLRPRILFTVVGLAYFLASDVSFSMAVGPFIFCTVAGILSKYGVVLRTGHHQSVKIEAFLFTGGYTGIVLMSLYTGRHYYWNVLKRSLGLRASDEVGDYAAWAMRVFLTGTLAFVVQLVVIGLDWQLAVLYTALALIIFCAVSRTIAETGAFYIGTEVFPGAIIWGFMGATALGPSTMLIMFLVTVILLVGPGWAPMPFMVQSLKLADDVDVKVSRVANLAVITLLLSTAIALPMILYWQYDRGALLASGGWPRYAATFPFENMVEIQHRLTAQGTLELSESLSGWRRFLHIAPTGPAVTAFFVALTLSIGIAVGRLRFAKWPFHPVMFVFLGGSQALTLSASFGLGWIIKSLVSKYGGEKSYAAVKPLMIGIIAGDMLAKFVPMVAGTVYYFVTGDPP